MSERCTTDQMRRIVLGTVQLGLPYGRRAAEATLPLSSVYEILDQAWSLGIRSFDTALAYGESSHRLAAWIESRGFQEDLDVVTKVVPSASLQQVKAAVYLFRDVAHRTVLSHGFTPAAQWSTFRAAVEAEGAVAGQSVYTTGEVAAAAGLPGVLRVQAPGNLFDRAALAARGNTAVALDLRSVYLQGILLETPEQAERRAQGAGVLAKAVGEAAHLVGNHPAVLLVAVMLAALHPRDRLVIGVDAPEQLSTLKRAMVLPLSERERFEQEVQQRSPKNIPASVMDPRTWKTVA